MTVNVEALADEILLSIFQVIRNSSNASALLPSLLTCRRWNGVGTRILYQDVVLRNKDIRKSMEPLKLHAHRVRTLSISLQPIDVEMYIPEGQPHRFPVGDSDKLRLEGSQATQTLWKDLKDLAVAIATMQNLSTFSITVDAAERDASKPGFWFHLWYLDVLLKALPASLIYLEVDLAFLDTPGDGGPIHLCPTIRQLLPQLKELRLHLRTLCDALLDDSREAPLRASNLEGFIMNTNDYIRRTSTCVPMDAFDFRKLVGYPQTFAPDGNTTTAPGVEVMRSSETESYWTSTCSKALQAGCFPKIRRLDVFDFEQARWIEPEESDAWEDDEYGLDPEAYEADHWNQHDVLAGKTYRFPVKRVDQGNRSIMLRTRGHVEEFGSYHTIGQRAEGPAWVESVGGIRFPASFAASTSAIGQSYVWKELALDSRDEFEKRSKYGGLEIWDVEGKTGMWVVDVEELDHF